jgi:hypothetical protein
MSEQDNTVRGEEQEAERSGLLLSVDPIEGAGEKLQAQKSDGSDTDTDLADTSDATDADASDESDTDGSDAADGDGTDGTDGDGSDSVSTDTDGTDSSGGGDADGSDAG